MSANMDKEEKKIIWAWECFCPACGVFLSCGFYEECAGIMWYTKRCECGVHVVIQRKVDDECGHIRQKSIEAGVSNKRRIDLVYKYQCVGCRSNI